MLTDLCFAKNPRNCRLSDSIPHSKVMETDIVYGLGIGADDYITKPFRIGELRARVTAHLRRERREHHNTLGFEQEIKFDLSSKEFFIKGKKVDLTKSEYEICEYLARNRGQVFTREQIYEAVLDLMVTATIQRLQHI